MVAQISNLISKLFRSSRLEQTKHRQVLRRRIALVLQTEFKNLDFMLRSKITPSISSLLVQKGQIFCHDMLEKA